MWDTRYRPLRFSDVLGQEGAVQVLKSRLRKGTALDTSYIFSGGPGRGKTTLARILGRAMLCLSLTDDMEPCNQCDNCVAALSESLAALSELDAASNGTIEHTRTIVRNLPFVISTGASKRIYIFDEIHRMSRDAQDVLLKPLEDKRVVGIFCTTELEKIRAPIRSRCEEYQIRKITKDHILQRLKWILEQENVEYEEEAVLTIIDHSGGHVRDAVNKLEMIAQLGPITLEAVKTNLNLSVISKYYQILLSLEEPVEALRVLEEVCDQVGPEEASEGLAEAAMNSFRLAHGMLLDFSQVDRTLATSVHNKYGDAVIKFAEYFLRSYKVSRMGLTCDLLICSQADKGIPVMASEATVVAPPVIISVAKPISEPSTVTKEATQTENSKLEQPIKEGSIAPPSNGKLRSDGIGDLGSGDVRALTSLDTKGVPVKPPRGKDQPKITTHLNGGSREEFLTPSEFTREFLILRETLK